MFLTKELSIRATIDSNLLNEPLTFNAIVDSGAGRSYIILDPETHIPIIKKAPDVGLSAQFADGTQVAIVEQIFGQLALISLNDEKFIENNVQLLVLRSRAGNQILLGRDLISRFKLQINASESVSIGDALMYEQDSEQTKLANLYQDKIQFVEDLISPIAIAGLPRCIVDDTAGPEEFLDPRSRLQPQNRTRSKYKLAPPIHRPHGGAYALRSLHNGS
jgi:hypothetical protein